MSVGIIANPFSGRDVRRFTSQAMTVTNAEKKSTVERMIISMSVYGVKDVYLMPDSFGLNQSIAHSMLKNKDVTSRIHILDYEVEDKPEETEKAVNMMMSFGIGCLIVLGGDGTSRLVAKTKADIPVIPVSTGTNNVYPRFEEGTAVGAAAAYICSNKLVEKEFSPDKIINIFVNGNLVDHAIVDAVITFQPFTASKAIWETDDIDEIFVCRTNPDAIGFSSIVGCVNNCTDSDDFGYRTRVATDGLTILPMISAGRIGRLTIMDPVKMDLGERFETIKNYNGTIALDGERTVTFQAGDSIEIEIVRSGIRKVNVANLLFRAVNDGFFKVRKRKINETIYHGIWDGHRPARTGCYKCSN